MFRSITKPNRFGERLGRMMGEQTSKLPTDTFLWGALGSIAVALALHMSGKKEHASFIGQWAPTILVLGLYGRLAKLLTRD